MKPITFSALAPESKTSVLEGLSFFHSEFLDGMEVKPETLLLIDQEYKFVELNGGKLVLMLPTKVIMDRKIQQNRT